MANQNAYIVKELDILKSIQYYRLKREKELLEIEKARAEGKITAETKWYNLVKKSKNAINRSKSEKKGDLLEKVNDLLVQFEKDNEEYKYNLYFEGKINDYLEKIYDTDKYGLRRLLLGITILQDDLYEYDYEDDEYEMISSLVYNNADKLNEIYKGLKSYYSSIYGKSFNIDPKGSFKSLGSGGSILLSAFPFIVSNDDNISSGLELLGINDVKLGFQFTILLSLFNGSDFSGDAYSRLKQNNISDLLNLVDSLSLSDLAFMLTIKALMFDEAVKRMMENDAKTNLIETLDIFNKIRVDIEYKLMVEKQKIKENKAKVEMINELYNEFMDSLKI